MLSKNRTRSVILMNRIIHVLIKRTNSRFFKTRCSNKNQGIRARIY